MNFRNLAGLALAASLTVGIAVAQETNPKTDMKSAGHETKNAVSDAGHGIASGTKKGYRKTKHGVKHLGHKIEGKKDTPSNNPPA